MRSPSGKAPSRASGCSARPGRRVPLPGGGRPSACSGVPVSRRRRVRAMTLTETPPAAGPEPSSSMRWLSPFEPRDGFGGCTAVTKMPSIWISASTRNTSPTATLGGSKALSTEPRGSRAPGARQVQVPSSRRLVSSMSILRGMADDHATRVAYRHEFREGSEASPRLVCRPRGMLAQIRCLRGRRAVGKAGSLSWAVHGQYQHSWHAPGCSGSTRGRLLAEA